MNGPIKDTKIPRLQQAVHRAPDSDVLGLGPLGALVVLFAVGLHDVHGLHLAHGEQGAQLAHVEGRAPLGDGLRPPDGLGDAELVYVLPHARADDGAGAPVHALALRCVGVVRQARGRSLSLSSNVP